jgi:hypothetical protein
MSQPFTMHGGVALLCLSSLPEVIVKYERTPPPEKLETDEQYKLIEWCLKTYPKQRPKLRELWDDCRDHYLMQGQAGWQIDWSACFRRWIRRAHHGPRERKPEPYPQEHRTHKKAELKLVRNIIEGVKNGTDKT